MKRRLIKLSFLLWGIILTNTSFGQLNKAYFFFKGEELLSKQKFNEALPYLNTLIGIDSTLYEGWFLRGVAKYNLGDLYGAISDFDKTIKINPVFAQVHHYKAIALNRVSQHKQALVEIWAALELKPNSPDFLFIEGITHFQMQDYAKAIEIFSKVIRLDASNPDAWINRGSARLLSSDTLGALSDYNLAIKVNPFYANAYSRRGILNAELNKPTLALADLNQAIKLDSLSIDNYFNRALVFYNLKQPQNALADLNKVLSIDSKYSLALFNRAIINYQIDNWQIALDDLTKLTALNPENVLIHYYRGSIYYEKKQYQKAINDFTTAINIFPDFANAYINRADVKVQIGDLKGAETDYNTGKQLIEKYKGTNQQNFASILDSSGKFNKLISLERDLNSASKLSIMQNNFKVTSAFMPMMRLCLNYPMQKVALIFEKNEWLDSINNNLPENYKLTLSTKTDNRAKEISVQTIDSVLNKNPYRSLLRGIVLNEKGRYANAKVEYQKAVQTDKANPLIQLNLIASNTDMARFIESFGDESKTLAVLAKPTTDTKNSTSYAAYTEAIDDLKELLPLADKATIAYNIGVVYTLANNFTEAINWYSSSIAENKGQASAYYNRGLAYLLTGNHNQGCIDLSTAGELGIPEAYDALNRFCVK
ncbi:MAG TPA: tetratricopeptide repeat protein [Tenuifilaceae bacterium]|nr:tetratricopeptide repeat protein [Tenuifilaceae bacterium]